MTTRGIRNNNPGNIRHVPGTDWVGAAPAQTDTAFVQFVDAVYGIRAIARILRSYERKGVKTLREAIHRWAPPNENDSQAYVDDVCAACAIGPDESVSLDTVLPRLIKAIIRHENGEQPYTDDQISRGISIA